MNVNVTPVCNIHSQSLIIHHFHGRPSSWFISTAHAHSAGAWWAKCIANALQAVHFAH
jgi:hypothetical protein